MRLLEAVGIAAAARSSDPAFRLFGWMNLVLFTGVVVQVLRFRGQRAS